jgi:hypothetical protein
MTKMEIGRDGDVWFNSFVRFHSKYFFSNLEISVYLLYMWLFLLFTGNGIVTNSQCMIKTTVGFI